MIIHLYSEWRTLILRGLMAGKRAVNLKERYHVKADGSNVLEL
jgi:hypothetical protein